MMSRSFRSRTRNPYFGPTCFGFAVTISLDGVGDVHDRQRPFKNGAGSYEQLVERIRPALKQQRRMQISARVTVTPENIDLAPTLEAFVGMGFHIFLIHTAFGRVSEAAALGKPEGKRQKLERRSIALGPTFAFFLLPLSATSTDFIEMPEQVGGIFVNPCGAGALEFLLPIAAGQ